MEDDALAKAQELILLPPVEWQSHVDKLSPAGRVRVSKELEAIATNAARLAVYMDARAGNGNGDVGHTVAVKVMNIAGRYAHCQLFGYNTYKDLRI